MRAIFKRELMAYFTSPIGYVFISVFAAISGIYFNNYILVGGYNDISLPLSDSMIILVLLVPVLTMRLIAEERSNRTDQLLLSSPVSVWSIVMGKFCAALCVFAGALLTTFPYVVIVAVHGAPVWGKILASYLGFFMLGLSFVSIGIFFSSITESQIIALVVTLGVLLATFLVGLTGNLAALLGMLPSTVAGTLGRIIDLFAVTSRYGDFVNGIFKLENMVYYLSLSAIFVFFTVRNIEKRRWN